MLHTTHWRRSAAVLSIATGLASAGCVGTPNTEAPIRVDTAFELPGDRVYPEGIAVDARTGTSYVGSFADGAVYRAAPGDRRAEIFLAAGADGRRTANGLRVDPAGRLWVIDSTTGVSVYDIDSRQLLARFDVTDTGDRFVNDIALGPDGSAYLTDSRRHQVYRITPDDLARAAEHDGHGRLDRGYDLTPTLEPHDPGAYTLNGIVADPAGAYLLTVDSTGGDLYRIDLTPSSLDPIRKVSLDGGDLALGDGLALDGSTLWAAHNTDDTVTRWTLSGDGSTATRTAWYHDEALDAPTTLIHDSGRISVVASQFDKGGPLGPGTPTTPFRVLELTGI